jgi:hypothetical protein
MSVEESPDREAILRAEVERSVAPYRGKVPPVMLDKLRELSERYWREHPDALRALRLLEHRQRVRSGTVGSEQRDDGAEAPTGTGKGKV